MAQPVRIKLTRTEAELSASEGVRLRNERIYTPGLADYFDHDLFVHCEDPECRHVTKVLCPYDDDIMSAHAQHAIAKWLGVPWSGFVGADPRPPGNVYAGDGRWVSVRWRRSAEIRLGAKVIKAEINVAPNGREDDEQPVVLVYGHSPRVLVAQGWNSVSEILAEGHTISKRGGGGQTATKYLGVECLRDMQTLRAALGLK